MTLFDKLEIPEKYIPFGYYCYENSNQKPCPFWDFKPGEFPYQEDGYCHFLGKSDWDINETSVNTGKIICNSTKNFNGKTLEEAFDGGIDPVSGKKEHFPLSLLWDQCKECGINMEEQEDVDLVSVDVEVHENVTKMFKKCTGGK